ncbi:integrase [Streptomyces albipurpureus]|uniref:Integrase n=1 Tax=Streptomyces albipurpureus TaxID=2897419 RepID=A0ABT0UJZ2_9ACTN|nr:integrase [Streptomyces sp. CWNU-1]MCM2388932.1 integrase [Streptomyces sp. CWNU-1]
MRVSTASLSRPGRANEDFVVASPEVTVVIDGAGTPEGLETGCVHGVSWFARNLGIAAFREALGADITLSACLAAAIEQTADLHRSTCAVDDPFSPSATVSMFRERPTDFEWLVLGDSLVALDSGGPTPLAVSDQRLALIARDIRGDLKHARSDSPEHRETHRVLVEAERSLRNTSGGYWVAAADPQAAAEAHTGSVARSKLVRAALLSDGAARLIDEFRIASWSTGLDILERKGPGEFIDQVRQAELSDPDCKRWPRGKVHDDATVAFLQP